MYTNLHTHTDIYVHKSTYTHKYMCMLNCKKISLYLNIHLFINCHDIRFTKYLRLSYVNQICNLIKHMFNYKISRDFICNLSPSITPKLIIIMLYLEIVNDVIITSN